MEAFFEVLRVVGAAHNVSLPPALLYSGGDHNRAQAGSLSISAEERLFSSEVGNLKILGRL